MFWPPTARASYVLLVPSPIVEILPRCLSADEAITSIAMAITSRTTASAPDAPSLPHSSAAPPAAIAGDPAELLNLTECQNWLQSLPSQEILRSKPLQRVLEVMDLLQQPSSREHRQNIQKLLSNWGVAQKAQGRKRKYNETKADLAAKVLEETHRLKRMRDDFGEPIPNGSDTNISAGFSAIQAALHHRSRGRLH